MADFYAEQLLLLKDALNRLHVSARTPREQSEAALDILNRIDSSFKQMVREASFQAAEDEIRYFKHQRPQLLSHIIYYSKIYHLETAKPPGSLRGLRSHYEKELDKIDVFFSENKDFVQYIRSGATVADTLLFMRNNISYKSVRESTYASLDPQQTTNYDHKAAKLFAYERLQEYLLTQLRDLKREEDTVAVYKQQVEGVPVSSALPAEKLIKSHQVLRLLHISESTLQKLRKNGTIPFRKIGGIYYYYESEILQVLEAAQRREFFGD
jgi:hypothetical protein